jgi:hypothetical protein
MNKDLAIKICSDFRPVQLEDGRVKCRFYNDDGICKRPEYFRCELLIYKQKQEALQITGPVISVPRISRVLRCPRLYAFNYLYKIDPPIQASWKVIEKTFSDCMAKIDLGISYSLAGEINSFQVAKAKLSAVLRRYKEWKKDWGELTAEVQVSFQYKDSFFIGFADRVTKDKKTIIEWRYSATKYDEIKAIRQACIFLKAIPEAENFVLAIAKKPLHKLRAAQKSTRNNQTPLPETPKQLEERIYKELADKEHEQFMYWNYDREFFDIDGTIEQLYNASKLVNAFEQAGFPPVLSQNCDKCEYRPYCLKHPTTIGCSDKRCSHPAMCKQIKEAVLEEPRVLQADVDFTDEADED